MRNSHTTPSRNGNREKLNGSIAHAEAILAATPPDRNVQENTFVCATSRRTGKGACRYIAWRYYRACTRRLNAPRRSEIHAGVYRCSDLATFYTLVTSRTCYKQDLDLEHALDHWRGIATAGLRTVPSPPSVRFHAALKWADVSCGDGRYKSAVEAYKIAMSLAPRVSLARRRDAINGDFDMIEAAPGEGNELLLNTFSLASDAAAAAIERGQPETAIEFLEQARTLLSRDAHGIP